MDQLIATINKYDPFYIEKVKRVVEVNEDELPARKKQFSAAELNRYLDFEAFAICACCAAVVTSPQFRWNRIHSKTGPGGRLLAQLRLRFFRHAARK
jgi:hypothetical protein